MAPKAEFLGEEKVLRHRGVREQGDEAESARRATP
jgi:hypothetical protein